MAVKTGGSLSVQPLRPPCPNSPPKYPDLYGKRREKAKVEMIEREISFLEDELKSVEGFQPASIYCKEVTDFVMAHSDALIPPKNRKSYGFWKWLCGFPCFNLACCCCTSGCNCYLKCPECCNRNCMSCNCCSSSNCNSCNCSSCDFCSCLSCCRVSKWRCCSCPKSHCCGKIVCSRNCCSFRFPTCTNCCCCSFRFPTCTNCCCCRWKCSCPKCSNCCICTKSFCNPCC